MNFSEQCFRIFEQATEAYHVTDNVDATVHNPYAVKSIEFYLYLKNWIDAVQWHLEDIIRNPEIDPVEALAIKRRIDKSNQDRTDLVELIDSFFLDKYKNVKVLPDATINTESPAWAIDRLSILTLKIYHMREEANRPDATAEHKARCEQKLAVLMEQKKEAIYLINDERYLHLRENGAGVGFATYNKVTGEPLESGQISEKNLPPDGRNMMSAARNWYLFELSDDDRKAIQQESVKILENIPQAGIGRRRIWEPETLPKDIRLINSHYDDLYRIPDGGVIQVDYPDGRSFTARVEHLDDYHFDMGGLGNVFHICQFAEVMERNHADFYPEIQTQDEQAAWELGGKGYLAIQSCEDGWDYTIYHSDFSVMDGGQLDAPELTIQEAREQILEAHHMEKGRRLLQDYDAVMDKVAEAEELSADHRPSTLEKLAELASDTSAPKSSARSAPEL